MRSLKDNNISGTSYERQWTEMYHFGWDEANIFTDWISEIKKSVRIFLVLGDSDIHLALLEAMHEQRLFDADADVDAADRYYFVVGVRADAWDSNGTFLLKNYIFPLFVCLALNNSGLDQPFTVHLTYT